MRCGDEELARRAVDLAARLPDALAPLAAVAYNYRWSWAADLPAVFRDINPYRLGAQRPQPGALPSSAIPGPRPTTAAATATPRCASASRRSPPRSQPTLRAPRGRGPRASGGPVAFFCAEFGFHVSMPIYSGGLGVLAGDLLKEASDQALPMIGVGLFYRRGYVHQRLDLTGRQQEYWVGSDPEALPDGRASRRPTDAPRSRSACGSARATSPSEVWRVDRGQGAAALRPDADLPANDPIGRWTTGRSSTTADRARAAQPVRPAGIGGAPRARCARDRTGGHPPERGPSCPGAARARRAAGRAGRVPIADALAVRATARSSRPTRRCRRQRNLPARGVPRRLRRTSCLSRSGRRQEFLGILPHRTERRRRAAGLTPLAMRMSHRRNGVSRLHGAVTRAIWQPMFPDARVAEVPITHVTNGRISPPSSAHRCATLFCATSARLARAPRSTPEWERGARDPQRRAVGGALRRARADRRLRA